MQKWSLHWEGGSGFEPKVAQKLSLSSGSFISIVLHSLIGKRRHNVSEKCADGRLVGAPLTERKHGASSCVRITDNA